jgi:RNA polymerase sigma-70 factor (ECF subfamily)
MNLDSQVTRFSGDRLEDISTVFWSLWQQYKNDIYRCCFKWMNYNPTDAEDALSLAMLKAWEKVQKYEGKITNFKAWLTRLTRNLCIDIHRARDRAGTKVEKIEAIASVEEIELVSVHDTPLGALERGEKKMVVRRAIDNLPQKMRETFILHFYQELSHQEISQQQDISYQNVCKRISQARAILRKELRGYWMGDDSKKRVRVEASAIETIILSAVVEEVEIVVSEEPQEVAPSQPQTESVMVVAQCDRKLEFKQNAFRWFEATLYIWQLTQALIKTLYRNFSIVSKLDRLHSHQWWRVWMDSGGYWLFSI